MIAPRPPDAFRLTAASLQEMCRPHVKEPNPWGARGLGWQIVHTDQGEVIQHGGDNRGFHAFAAASIERRFGAVVDFIEVSNCASLSVERALGGRAIGYVGYVKGVGRILIFRSPGARKVGFEFLLKREAESLPCFDAGEDSEAPDQRAG
jgi:hypothetical protein